jgi:uncharacterized membrane protein
MGTIKSYFIGINIALIALLAATWFGWSGEHFNNIAIFAAGFEFGAISAALASKIYKRW